jgi:hypothetical protein
MDWYEQRHTCTKAYEDHLLLSLINNTVEDVSIKEKISYDIVQNVLDHRISEKVDWNTIQKIDILGIDEISLKKGHKDFVVIVTAFIDGQLRIIAVLKNREKATIKEFFLSIPKRLRKTVKAVCSDLYVGFINAAKEVFGKKVRIIADRFHVARLYRDDLDTLRKQEMKRLKKKLKAEEYKKLNNIMWILRKSPKDLTEEELLDFIREVKSRVKVPVGYVDAYYEFTERPEITDLCDVILCNCYPFWEGCPFENSLAYMQQMYGQAKDAAKGKPVLITETGWPSQGENLKGSFPGMHPARDYFINTQLWSANDDIPVFYFSSFDESWKVGAEGIVGAYWGIWDKNEKLKF